MNKILENPKLSFCITCKNRIEQIKKTLPLNLSDNNADHQIIEFVLIDFASNDGLKNWITGNFKKELNSGYLKYYYTEKLSDWHASIAKNTAHFYANNDILVNLDCDNYTGYRGGNFVMQQFIKRKNDNIILHQFNNFGDGSFGRISLMKHFFDKIGGYDESFEPMGFQDGDLIRRLQSFGLKYLCLKNQAYNRAEKNTKIESIANTNSDLSWRQMEKINRRKSMENIQNGIIYANNGQYGIRSDVHLIK